MFYLICLIVGAFAGALGVWVLMMNAFEATRSKEKEWRTLIDKAKTEADSNNATTKELAQHSKELDAAKAKFDAQVITFAELRRENAILKSDLRNIDVMTNKLELDRQIQEEKTNTVAERSQNLAMRYLAESVKSIVGSLGSNNFSACKQRLVDVIARCRGIGFEIQASEETKLFAELRSEFEKAVRAAFEREEQARIKSQIREEERLKREVDRELRQLERERLAIQAALDQALAAAQGQHSAEVQRLQDRLAEAELKAQRTLSMAQQTKSGHIYVISNIGSMGQGIFKVGMTRRLEPQERVDELGSASVPFPFDVHMMIKTDNAPALENALHRALHKQRVNRANPRKEFFRASIEEICEIVKLHHGEVSFQADPDARI